MNSRKDNLALLLLSSLIAAGCFALWQSLQSTGRILAYPDAEATPTSESYPSWTTATFTPSPTVPGEQVTGTPTPWPTPTLDDHFTPESTPRKGVAPNLTSSNFAVVDRHNFVSWAYYWGPYAALTTPGAPNFVEYVPMAAGNIRTTPDATLVARAATRTPTHHYWLVFNECENNAPEQC